mgnify:CR=1 FL=1
MVINNELERLILGYGGHAEVIAPPEFRAEAFSPIRNQRLRYSFNKYGYTVNASDDLALMRSDRLGYNAPIVVRENKYYEYEDPDYSTTHLPLNDEGLDALNSALDILRQLQGFPQLASSIDTISKLNEQISRHTGSSVPAALGQSQRIS